MAELYNRDDLSKNDKFIKALYDINLKRTGVRASDPDKLIDDFIEEYRFIQSNTFGMIKFANFATSLEDSNPEDRKIKDDLAFAYNLIDKQTEDFISDDSLDFGEKLSAVGDYLLYGALDPLNVLGFGMGKAVTVAASRPLVKGVINNSLGGRLKKAALAGGVAEASVAFPSQLVLQETEKTLGDSVREKTSIAEAAINTAPSFILGGVLGGVGGFTTRDFTKGKKAVLGKADEILGTETQSRFFNNKSAEEIIEESMRNIETTPQGHAAAQPTLKSLFDEEGIGAIKYVYAGRKDSDFSDLNNIGRIEDVQDGIAVVKYRVKDKDTGTTEFVFDKIKLDDLKAASVSEQFSYVKFAQKDLRAALDPQMVAEGRELLRSYFKGDQSYDEFDVSPDAIKAYEMAVFDIVAEDPDVLRGVDLGNRSTQVFADIVANTTREQLTEKLGKAFSKYNLSPEEFAKILLADASNAGKTLSAFGNFTKKFEEEELLTLYQIGAGNPIDMQNAKTRKLLDSLKGYKEVNEDFGYFHKIVDLWRGTIVSQPETTMRNIIGLVAQVPGQTLGVAIDNLMYGLQRTALGLDPSETLVKKDSYDFIRNNLSAEDSITLTKYLTSFDKFNVIDDTFFKGFDIFTDSFQDNMSDGLKNSASYKGFKAVGSVVDKVNVLNRHVDQAVKSSAFLSAMNAAVVDGINLGQIKVPKDADGNPVIKDFMDVIAQNRFDLIDSNMITDSIDFAFRVSYQAKASDMAKELRGRGVKSADIIGAGLARVLEGAEGALNKLGPIGKTFIPFQRFLFNMHFHIANRTYLLPINIVKDSYRLIRSQNAKQAEMTRAEREILNRVNSEIESLSKKFMRSEGKDRVAIKEQLQEKARFQAALEEDLGLKELDFAKIKQTIRHSIDSAALLGSAYALREAYGSDQGWSIFETSDGTTVDLRTWFPFAHFLFIAETIRRFENAKPGDSIPTADLRKDYTDVLLGANIRTGPLAYFVNNFEKVLFGDEADRSVRVGAFVGESIGGFVNGFLTPLRAVDEAFVKTNLLPSVVESFADAAGASDFLPEKFLRYRNREQYQDTRLNIAYQEGELPTFEASSPTLSGAFRGFVNGVSQSATRGPLSRVVFDEKPQFSTTTGKVRRVDMPQILEQLSGLGVGERANVVSKEMLRANLDPYAQIMKGKYSGIPQHDALYRQVIGNLISENLVNIVSSPQFKAAPLLERQDAITRQLSDLKKAATKRIQEQAPLLSALARFRKTRLLPRKKAIKLYEERTGVKPNFTYTGEDNLEQLEMMEFLERAAKQQPMLVDPIKQVPKTVKGTASLRKALEAIKP